MMTTFLTWNINNKKNNLLQKVLLEIIDENEIDVLVLQEAYGVSVNTLLNSYFEEVSYPGKGVGSGVRIFLKIGKFQQFSVQRTDNKKLVFAHLKNKTSKSEFNIAAVHLYSKVGNSERQQLWKNLPLIKKLREFEKTSTNNKNTILVGDFNHNPFESDLCDPNMINGVENKNLISTLTLSPLSNKNLDFWYNPMWNLMGDYDFRNNGARVTGSYFKYADDESLMWNLLDGFILRPTLMDKVDYQNSEIITKTKSESFLKPFIIRKDESIIKDDLSDHLPIKFTLKIK